MSDTIETDIHRVHIIANEILPRYHKPKLSFEELRKVADGPFDFFLAPILFEEDYLRDPSIIYNEGVRREIRGHALEIARRHGSTSTAGLHSRRRGVIEGGPGGGPQQHGAHHQRPALQAPGQEEHGISEYFEEIIDRDETYFGRSRASTTCSGSSTGTSQ